eukprot:jgi/Botrbrau1/677/Bobra.160_2s0002.1
MRHCGPPPKETSLHRHAIGLLGAILAGSVAVMYVLRLGPFGGEKETLRRAEKGFLAASRRYHQAAANAKRGMFQRQKDEGVLSSLFQKQQEALARLNSVRESIEQKALSEGRGGGLRTQMMLRRPLYDSEDDGTYYSDEDIITRRVRVPWGSRAEEVYPTGVSSESEGDFSDDERYRQEKSAQEEQEEGLGLFHREPTEERPENPLPDLVRVDPEVR